MTAISPSIAKPPLAPPPRDAHRPQVVAHRGFHHAGAAVENTLPAFEAAVARRADVVELDVQRTQDGVLVVHHDAKLADGRAINEVLHRDLPAMPDGTVVPTLDQVLEWARTSGARLQVEFKEQGYEVEAVERILRALPPDRFEAISFRPDAIRRIERAHPQVRTGLLQYRLWDWLYRSPVWSVLKHVVPPSVALERARSSGADFLSVHHSIAGARLLDTARERRLPVYVWTANEPGQLARLMSDPRVSGVVTDRIDLAVPLRDARPA